MVGLPLIFLASVSCVFVLYSGREILVPFTIAVFFVYLIRPVVNFFNKPFGHFCSACVPSHRYTALPDSSPDEFPRRTSHERNHREGICSKCCALRLPRWLSVVLALFVAVGILAGNVLMIADAIQTFEDNNLESFESHGMAQLNRVLDWTKKVFDVDI